MENASRLPRSFYVNVVDQIDPRLLEFYNMQKGNKYFESSFFEICAGVLSEVFQCKEKAGEPEEKKMV